MKKEKLACILMILLFVTSFSFSSKGLSLENGVEQDHSLTNYDYSEWYWTETEVLTTTSGLESWYPEMAIDSQENIHAVWRDKQDYGSISGTDSDIWYMKWDSTTEVWSSPFLISVDSTASTFCRDAQIVIDGQDNIHIVWSDNTNDLLSSGSDEDLFYINYNNITDTWSPVEVVTSQSLAIAYLPDMDVDSSGNVHVVYTDMTPYGSVGADMDVFYQTRSNSTGLWSSPELISLLSDSASTSAAITVSSDNIAHFVWMESHDFNSDGTDIDIYYYKKDLNTGLWDYPLILLSPESDELSSYPSICSDSQNSVHIIWSDQIPSYDSDLLDDLYYASWDSVQDQWSLTTEIITDDSLGQTDRSDICVDLFDNLHIIYEDLYFGVETYRLYHKTKLFGSDEWSPPTYVSSESIDWSSQYMYSLTADSKGYIHALWADNTDFDGAGTDYDLFYKKFVGSPSSPFLLEIYPKSTTNTQVNLRWVETLGATSYKIYKDTTFITDISSLTSIGNSLSGSFVDTITTPNTYYYAVVAVSDYGDSVLSNVVYVEILSESDGPGFFDNFDWNMLLILGGILLGAEILIAVILYYLLSSKSKKSASKKSGKKTGKKKK